eukprot:TRINITY_DN2237_c0_g1_i1.p1 TRINITY_DN2237_c0_g1~~TRINITY_DN2237_c0_g1_i1.p1  ORF type:complete len:132 (-),score=4.05 TRINITY_DN2237_c0_g1_i1:91-459(-)
MAITDKELIIDVRISTIKQGRQPFQGKGDLVLGRGGGHPLTRGFLFIFLWDFFFFPRHVVCFVLVSSSKKKLGKSRRVLLPPPLPPKGQSPLRWYPPSNRFPLVKKKYIEEGSSIFKKNFPY